MKKLKQLAQQLLLRMAFTPVRAVTLVKAKVKPGLKIRCISSMRHDTHYSTTIHYDDGTIDWPTYTKNEYELFVSERSLLESLL